MNIDPIMAEMLRSSGVPEDQWESRMQSLQAQMTPARGVSRSEELVRILNLPRRLWETDSEALAERVTMYLRAPGGTQKLRPVQAATLKDAHDQGGAFCSQRVGAGKSISSFLGATVLGAQRAILLIPAKLKEKTVRDMHAARKHWLVPGYIRVVSYELLGRAQSANLLEEWKPDLIIADECFVGDTLVRTDVGDVPIRDVVERRVGGYALSYGDGALVWKPIVRRMRKPRNGGLVRVVHEHGSFDCTPEHKIYVDGRKVRAADLVGGDRLQVLRSNRACAAQAHGRIQDQILLERLSHTGEQSEAVATSGDQLQGLREGRAASAQERRSTAVLLKEVSRSIELRAPKGRGAPERAPLRPSCSLQGLRSGVFHATARDENFDVLHAGMREGAHARGEERSAEGATEEVVHEDVRVVREDVQLPFAGRRRVREASLLQQRVFDALADQVRAAVGGAAQGVFDPNGQHLARQAGTLALRTHALEQPHEESRDVGEDVRGYEGAHVPLARWQRSAHEATDLAGRTNGVCDGVRDFHTWRGREELAALLQGGLGDPGVEDRDRSRRSHAQDEEVEVPRSTQDGGTRVSRVVRVEVLERGGVDGPRGRDGEDSFVYDLEVEGTHNYFANGSLVSNCHRMKNTGASVTRRVGRYMEAYPETKMIALSGTIMKRSIKDYAHVCGWCLKERSPTPRPYEIRMEWSMAIDDMKGEDNRLAIGALQEFCGPEEIELQREDPIKAVRRAYRRRLTETPGVVATQEGALSMSLSIEPLIVKCPTIKAWAQRARTTWERPDRVEMMDGFAVWRHLRELATGFFYRWSPPPPKEWVEARRAWAARVRKVLTDNRRGLESEKMVADAIDLGQYPGEELHRWREVKPLYDPEKNKEAVWLSDACIDAAIKWAHEEKGIVWVEHVAFGVRMAAKSGLPFYQNLGLTKVGKKFIEDHPHGTPMIAAREPNFEGRNLQFGWSKMLMTTPTTVGGIAEQTLGRLHREGQGADEVVAAVMAALPEALYAFDQSCQDARVITDTTGQEQKLCYADITIPPLEDRAGLWG